jgi:SAM-dependent methyltransferase
MKQFPQPVQIWELISPISRGRRGTSVPEPFSLYFDQDLTKASPYHSGNEYFRKARDRMDRTFEVIRPYVPGAHVLDVGASPFYLLDRALASGALQAEGVYFANDTHPLKAYGEIYSRNGQIGLHHLDVESEDLPFADNSFELLSACEILEHLEHFPARFGGEIRRVLRGGGYLCLTVPNVGSIGNILKLIGGRNIYMKYRSDPTGRHKHEYTMPQLKAFVRYLGMDVIDAGYFPSPTSAKMWLRPIYRLLAKLPFIRRYSPVLYIVARQPERKVSRLLSDPPPELYTADRSIEE